MSQICCLLSERDGLQVWVLIHGARRHVRRHCTCSRTNVANTNGAAAKVMNLTGVPKKSLCQIKIAVTPLELTPSVPLRALPRAWPFCWAGPAWAGGSGCGRSAPRPVQQTAANLRTKTLDFRGFDSSRILLLRGGTLMSDCSRCGPSARYGRSTDYHREGLPGRIFVCEITV